MLWAWPLYWMVKTGRVKAIHFKLAIIPTFINILAQIFLALSPYFMQPGLLMFLSRIAILFSISFSFIIFADERRLISSHYFWLGLITCIAGFVGLNLAQGNLSSTTTWTGLFVVLGHALFIGMYGVSIRYYMRGVKPWYSFPIICVYTSVILFALMWIFGEPHRFLEMQPHRMGIVVFSSLVGIAVAHVAFYYSLEHLGVSISSSSGLIMPFLTAIGSFFIFGEIFSTGQLTSGVMLLVGAGLLLWAQQHLGGRHTPVVSSNMPEIEEFASGDYGAEVDESSKTQR